MRRRRAVRPVEWQYSERRIKRNPSLSCTGNSRKRFKDSGSFSASDCSVDCRKALEKRFSHQGRLVDSHEGKSHAKSLEFQGAKSDHEIDSSHCYESDGSRIPGSVGGHGGGTGEKGDCCGTVAMATNEKLNSDQNNLTEAQAQGPKADVDALSELFDGLDTNDESVLANEEVVKSLHSAFLDMTDATDRIDECIFELRKISKLLPEQRLLEIFDSIDLTRSGRVCLVPLHNYSGESEADLKYVKATIQAFKTALHQEFGYVERGDFSHFYKFTAFCSASWDYCATLGKRSVRLDELALVASQLGLYDEIESLTLKLERGNENHIKFRDLCAFYMQECSQLLHLEKQHREEGSH